MTLTEIIQQAIEEKKGMDIEIIDFKNQGVVDTFVICDAPSLRQVNAIVDHIRESVEKAGFTVGHIEGDSSSRWVLVDCLDVIAHVFITEERSFYQLEKLWADYLRKQ
ncbi:MAG: ribosome silencing factor [Firmicutes bacterium HGW-Firmicutes-19]|jgi:ribosome-associated protein|nr:MAG: ribosome silencing factor [Firmicutes bacterium HGW-Firmicutes-19]